MKVFTPRDYQGAIMRHVFAHQRANVFAGMGTGKTVAMLSALDDLSVVEDCYPALVVAPLRVARRTWPNEQQKWGHLHRQKIRPIVGEQHFRVKMANSACRSTDADVYTINYEQLPWLIEHLGDEWPFNTVLADESTRLKGFRIKQGGSRAHALGQVAHRTPRWVNFTGTPTPNGLRDLWGQLWFIDQGARLGRSYSAFDQRWFYPDRSGYGTKPFPHAFNEIMALIADVTISIEAGDYMDLPPVIENRVYIDLPHKAAGQYKQMEKEFFMEVESVGIEAVNAGVKTMKLLQVANGAAYLDKETKKWGLLHDEKLEALDEIINESNGASILVAYQFRSDLERLQKRYPKARNLGANDRDIDAFCRGDFQIGLAHPKSMGHGIDGIQDVCNIVAFFGHDWNAEERQQIIGRIGPTRQVQAGTSNHVYVHDIVARGTIEEALMARVADKLSVEQAVIQYMKRR